MTEIVSITACYAFVDIAEDRLRALQDEIRAFGNMRAMKGLVLLAPEGINSTVCGTPEAIAEWKERMRAFNGDMVFKDSCASPPVFRRWSVKIKPELITFKQPGIVPGGKHKALTPHEWKRMMEREDVVLVDARNAYEVAIGTFRNALNPRLKHFHHFPEAIRALPIPKGKTVMLYCTGGIRCEKAVPAMEALGYANVYQLEGGILAYLERYPDDGFQGECFVFDHRVAVDQHLRPSTTYRLCAECGDPAISAMCAGCAKETFID